MALDYAEVTSRVFKVRVMVLEYAPRIPGTHRGFRVRYDTRRSFRVRVIVLGFSPDLYSTHRWPAAYLRCVSWF